MQVGSIHWEACKTCRHFIEWCEGTQPTCEPRKRLGLANIVDIEYIKGVPHEVACLWYQPEE